MRFRIFKRKKKVEDKGTNLPGHSNPPEPPKTEEPKEVKSKKKKEGMNVEKQIAKFKERHAKAIEDCQGDVEVITLERKHFKDTLTQSNGFGFQDLKKKPRKLISQLMADGYDLAFTPSSKNMNASDFGLKITASKKKFK